jgi:hypothetical protein
MHLYVSRFVFLLRRAILTSCSRLRHQDRSPDGAEGISLAHYKCDLSSQRSVEG